MVNNLVFMSEVWALARTLREQNGGPARGVSTKNVVEIPAWNVVCFRLWLGNIQSKRKYIFREHARLCICAGERS